VWCWQGASAMQRRRQSAQQPAEGTHQCGAVQRHARRHKTLNDLSMPMPCSIGHHAKAAARWEGARGYVGNSAAIGRHGSCVQFCVVEIYDIAQLAFVVQPSGPREGQRVSQAFYAARLGSCNDGRMPDCK